ncbi:MAG: prolyl oligopeptidase family serine peptidase, partial [Verrucomicrobiales bacterium]|nr:prolyl oligopeptidase family serine peptidase [Verrucomicrobiales bacterium]
VLLNPALDLKAQKQIHQKWGEEAWRKNGGISPIEHVSKDLPPTIIFHGEADKTVLFDTARGFKTRADRMGAKKVELIGYPEKGHGFFNYGRKNNEDYDATVKEMTRFLRELGWIQSEG